MNINNRNRSTCIEVDRSRVRVGLEDALRADLEGGLALGEVRRVEHLADALLALALAQVQPSGGRVRHD